MVTAYDFSEYFSAGARFGNQSIRHSRSNFSLVDLATAPAKRLIKFKTTNSPSADLALSFWGTELHYLLPYLTVQAKNLFSGFKIKDAKFESTEFLEPFALFETHYQFTVGRVFRTSAGAFKTGLNAFANSDLEVYNKYVSLGLGYDLNKISVNLELAEYRRSLGFVFKSRVVDLGFIYANEKELGNIQNEYSDSVLLAGNFHI